MGQDARVRYTKMMIREKFVGLLKEKPLNKITVKELCALAEINRATFYKYYCDVYDLMEQMEQGILEELRETMRASAGEEPKKMLTGMLEKMQESGDLYVTLFSQHGDPHFPTKIFQMCYAELSEQIRRRLPRLTKDQQVWLYIYTAQGSSGILHYWISTGMVEPPEEVAGFMERLVESTVGGMG